MKKNFTYYLGFLLGSILFACFNVDAAETLPYSCSLSTEEEFATWTTYNNDEIEASWFFGKSDCGGSGAQSKTDVSTYKDTDNWLVSPGLELTTGIDYQISMMVYTAYYDTETFRVTMGTTPEPESQTTILGEYSVCSYYGQKLNVALPEIAEDGTYYIGIEHYATGNLGMLLHINNVTVKAVDEGKISGIVYNADNEILKGVKLTLSGKKTMETSSDKEGEFEFVDVLEGDYTLTASVFGYSDYSKSIKVSAGQSINNDIVMAEVAKYSVTGSITDNAGNAIPGAYVYLEGYDDYRTFSDETGNYVFSGVYESSEDYVLRISKNNFTTFESSVKVSGGDAKAAAASLSYDALPPFSVTAVQSGLQPEVSWEEPKSMTYLFYDNDNASQPLGFAGGRENNAIGVVYRHPMTIHSVEWFTISDSSKTPYVHLYIIDLDENGNPTGSLLYKEMNIQTTDDIWTIYDLPTPVEAPNGFLLALSGDGYIGIAKDSNPEILGGKTQCYSNVFTAADSYTYFEDVDWAGALMLRAYGEQIETPKYSPNVEYDIYRIAEGDEKDNSKWVSLAKGLNENSFKDTEFAKLGRGTYCYAVVANYLVDELSSEARLSNSVYNQEHTSLVVNVTTNADASDSEGAIVYLTDSNKEQVEAIVAGGKAVFEVLWKDVYALKIVQKGFEVITENVDLSNESSYELSYELKQILAPVNNIDALATEKEGEQLILWDQFSDIFDGFDGEEYSDFQVNAPGLVGWQYIDNDYLDTYGFGATTFPGMNGKMAAIVFNSTTTSPQLGMHTAYEGDRSLAFFAARYTQTESGIVLNVSDDYLISPELSFHKDYEFKFFARSYDDENGLERIRVGYSLGGTNLDDFTYLDESLFEVPTEYTEYSYSIPKEAKHVVLNSSSNDGFILLVDNISIGTGITHSSEQPSVGKVNGYNVYLDGELVGSTVETTMLLKDLADGEHTAEVSKLYNGGESPKLSVVFNTQSGIVTPAVTQLNIYVRTDKSLVVKGDYESLCLYGIDGKTIINGAVGKTSYDLSDLQSGVYVVKTIDKAGKVKINKVIIK